MMKALAQSTLSIAVAEFCKHIQKEICECWVRNNYLHKTPQVQMELSTKFIKIATSDKVTLAFVAVKDNETKTLGKVQLGDIFATSHNAPAKHARGNIFRPDEWAQVTDGNGCIRRLK